MSLAAIALDPDLCPDCLQRPGRLCEKDECRNAVLPQLAKNIGWLRLIGIARTEQTQRQSGNPSPAEKRAIERIGRRIGRRNARKAARSSRRGYFGLAKAIQGPR